MESKSFCYWLQGLFELADPKTLDEKQVGLIKRHLNMVFIHEIDPSYPKEQQKSLNDAHSGVLANPPKEAKPATFVKKNMSDLLIRC